MKKSILIFLLALAFASISAQTNAYSSAINISNNDNFVGFESIRNLAQNKRLIVTGKVDGYGNFNDKFEFKYFKYVNKIAGVKNILMEMGPAKANLVDEYINSSDSASEKLLQSVSSPNAMRKYRSLKKLNELLADSAKIHVYGIDVEKYKSLPLVHISQILPKDSIPNKLRISVEALQGAAKYIITKGLENYENELKGKTENSYYYNPGAFSIDATMQIFIADFDSLKPLYQTWLGSKYSELELAIGWLKETKEWDKYEYSAFRYSLREEFTFTRLQKLLEKFPKEKFYGQFALCRISKAKLEKGCNFYNYSGIVCRLIKEKVLAASEICSIGIMYQRDTEAESDYDNGFQREGQDPIHFMLNKVLRSYFDSIPSGEAKFFAPETFKTKDSIVFAHFNAILLNNNYPTTTTINTDTADSDSTTKAIKSKSEYAWIDEYRKARVYMGWNLFRPDINIGEMNAVLIANGYNGISSLNSAGLKLVFASADRSSVAFFASQSKSGQDYSNYRVTVDLGYNFLYSKHIKWSINASTGYIHHKLTLNKGNNATTYFSSYKAPIIIENPCVFLGANTAIYLEYGPFFVSIDGSRIYDLGNPRWTINGLPTGTNGKLSNTSWAYGFGFGIALKMEDLDL